MIGTGKMTIIAPAITAKLFAPVASGKNMLANAETLKQFWLRQGIKLRHGATEEEFAAFELKYNIRLPTDLREYLIIM